MENLILCCDDQDWRPQIIPKPSRRMRRWFWKTEAANVNMHPSKGFFVAAWNAKKAEKPGDEHISFLFLFLSSLLGDLFKLFLNCLFKQCKQIFLYQEALTAAHTLKFM